MATLRLQGIGSRDRAKSRQLRGLHGGRRARWATVLAAAVASLIGVRSLTAAEESSAPSGPALGAPTLNDGESFVAEADPKAPPKKAEGGFISLFDGKTLKGWDGNPKFWRVEDGTITGQTTKENPTKGNTFLIWTEGETNDFELTLEYKIIGGNSGIQYRSFEDQEQEWVVGGYQADFEAGDTYSGILYGERFRGILANRGQKTVLENVDGKFRVRVVGMVGDSKEIQSKIKKEDWNSYHITAKGFHFVHRINGVVTAECTDEDTKMRRATGILALQLHAGPPMKVQFRNIRIKHLKAAPKPAAVSGASFDEETSPVASEAELPVLKIEPKSATSPAAAPVGKPAGKQAAEPKRNASSPPPRPSPPTLAEDDFPTTGKQVSGSPPTQTPAPAAGTRQLAPVPVPGQPFAGEGFDRRPIDIPPGVVVPAGPPQIVQPGEYQPAPPTYYRSRRRDFYLRLPFIRVQVDGQGVNVRAPFTRVGVNPDGTRVIVPGPNVYVPRDSQPGVIYPDAPPATQQPGVDLGQPGELDGQPPRRRTPEPPPAGITDPAVPVRPRSTKDSGKTSRRETGNSSGRIELGERTSDPNVLTSSNSTALIPVPGVKSATLAAEEAPLVDIAPRATSKVILAGASENSVAAKKSATKPGKVTQKNSPSGKIRKIKFIAGRRSHGYGAHEHRAGCMLLAKALNESGLPVQATVYTDGWPQDASVLNDADVIVIYADGGGGHPFNAHIAEIDRLMKKGVGLVCIHYAVEIPKGKAGDAFLEWTGGYFEANWSVNPHWVANYKSLPKHPVTRGVQPFSIDDEWYYHMRFRDKMEGVTPILTDIPPAHTLSRPDGPHSGNPAVRATKGQPQHMAWARERPDGGRGFGITGGHVHWNWGHNQFRKLVLNAIVWAAHVDVPAQGVTSKPLTVKDLEANQDFPPSKDHNPARIQKLLDQWNNAHKTAPVAVGR